MGLSDLFKILGGHHGGHHGSHHDRRYDSHNEDHHNHSGRGYGYSDQCGGNAVGQGASASQYPCPKCTVPVKAGFKFCPSCGGSLEPTACKNCGEKLPSSASFCSGCGTKV